MKKMKKGFTIVEIVIVIAVIAILAAVLIPTFASIVDKANASNALQEAKNAYTVAYADAIVDDGYVTTGDDEVSGTDGIQLVEGDYTFTVDANSVLTGVSYTGTKYAGYTFDVDNGAITVTKTPA